MKDQQNVQNEGAWPYRLRHDIVDSFDASYREDEQTLALMLSITGYNIDAIDDLPAGSMRWQWGTGARVVNRGVAATSC